MCIDDVASNILQARPPSPAPMPPLLFPLVPVLLFPPVLTFPVDMRGVDLPPVTPRPDDR
jgi:hypothetical protein